MEIAELVKRSRAAQQVIAGYSQEKIDSIVRMFAKVVYDNAEPRTRDFWEFLPLSRKS